MNTGQDGSNQTEINPIKKKRVRSPYLFPAYDFNLARQIAETVEKDGAGSLSEETLAIALHLSAKSSGFQLKTLTARQFGLITKQGGTLMTTPLAKAMLKPTTEEERTKALAKSFLAIPLFREVATKYRGQPIPQGQALRNILEREFGIDGKRVSDAERVLTDSARAADVLVTSGNNTYISTEKAGVEKPIEEPRAEIEEEKRTLSNKPKLPPPPAKGLLHIIAEEDLLALTDDQFKKFWEAYGEIVRSRAKREPKADSETK
jgi:hypothetical protein